MGGGRKRREGGKKKRGREPCCSSALTAMNVWGSYWTWYIFLTFNMGPWGPRRELNYWRQGRSAWCTGNYSSLSTPLSLHLVALCLHRAWPQELFAELDKLWMTLACHYWNSGWGRVRLQPWRKIETSPSALSTLIKASSTPPCCLAAASCPCFYLRAGDTSDDQNWGPLALAWVLHPCARPSDFPRAFWSLKRTPWIVSSCWVLMCVVEHSLFKLTGLPLP